MWRRLCGLLWATHRTNNVVLRHGGGCFRQSGVLRLFWDAMRTIAIIFLSSPGCSWHCASLAPRLLREFPTHSRPTLDPLSTHSRPMPLRDAWTIYSNSQISYMLMHLSAKNGRLLNMEVSRHLTNLIIIFITLQTYRLFMAWKKNRKYSEVP